MFQTSSPNRLYQDHQLRVEAALLRRTHKLEAQPLARRDRTAWQKVTVWLTTLQTHAAQLLQPAEEGYIA